MSDTLPGVKVDPDDNQIVIDGVAVSVTGPEGVPLEIDHFSAQDGYVAFLEPGENGGVNPNGAEATIVLQREQ